MRINSFSVCLYKEIKLHGGLKIWIAFSRLKSNFFKNCFYHSKITFISSRRHWIYSVYLKVVTRYLCIHRLSFEVQSAKKGEVEDIAAAAEEERAESSGVLVLTRWQSDNHYLVPFQQGSNIPVKIQNVFRIVVRNWEGNEKETTRKNGNSKLQLLVAWIKTVLTKRNSNSIRCLHGWHRQVRKYSK